MLLAQSVVVWGAGLFVLGLLAFFVLVIAGVVWVFTKLVTSFLGGDEPSEQQPFTPQAPRRRICHQPDCGHRNEPTALYCARCGRKLHATTEM